MEDLPGGSERPAEIKQHEFIEPNQHTASLQLESITESGRVDGVWGEVVMEHC